MHQCLYCATTFATAPKEHILQNFLGARWQSDEIVCNSCQVAFGQGIDVALEIGLQPIRNLMGTEGGRGGKGPALKGLPTSKGQVIDLMPGGEPRLKEPQVSVIPRPDGRHDVRIGLGHPGQLGWAVKKLQAQLPHAQVSVATLAPLMQAARSMPGRIGLDLKIGGPDYFRGLLKSCFNLLGVSHPAVAQDPSFGALRRFVLEGIGDTRHFVRWTADAEPLHLSEKGPIDHVVALTTRGEVVEGIVQLFGHITHPVRLTASYVGPKISCSYVVDPLRAAAPAEARNTVDELRIPEFEAQAPQNNEAVQAAFRARLRPLVDLYQQTGRAVTAERILQDFATEFANQPFSGGLASVLARRLADMYA